MTRAVHVTGAAALSAFGDGWRGLGEALAGGAPLAGLPAEQPLANPRARKMMSRGAYLAARCLGALLRDVAWTDGRDRIGYFLGVGASGGSLDDVIALLEASIADGAFSLARFGDRGLAACNPLLAFQLMNNFTMCHGAILEGLGGPNTALFSRGAGTTAALIEAVHAVRAGDCERAIAGGADTATHPVTRAELVREGFVARGLVPGDGGALIALAADGAGRAVDRDAITIEGCAIASGRARSIPEVIDEAVAEAGGGALATGDLVVLAPWGPPARDALHGWAQVRAPRATVLDTSPLGACLAASPALAWVAAIDLLGLLGDRAAHRALVLDHGVDGDVGAVVLARGAA